MGSELVLEDPAKESASGKMCDERSSVVVRIAAADVRLWLEVLGMIAGSLEERFLVAVDSSRFGLVVIESVEGHIGAVAGLARRLGGL